MNLARMKCPHCLTAFHDAPSTFPLGTDVTSYWVAVTRTCPTCRRLIISLLENYDRVAGSKLRDSYANQREFFCYPRAVSRVPLSPNVPATLAGDYREACITLVDSPKASAALSRRCLQHVLREHAKVKHSDLFAEIQEVLDSRVLPTHLADSLDAIRNIGNFAAHPIKSKASGEIIDVEPGEAEWNLDVLEGLFDFYFVQPAETQKRREALNAKLKAAGKPEMK